LPGMPISTIGCESAICDNSWHNAFGIPFSLSGVSPMESPGIGAQASASLLSSRPSTTDEFDPLCEDEVMSFGIGQSMSSSTAHSALHQSSPLLPPRHHKDDPILAKSRYRNPLFAHPSRRVNRIDKAKNGQKRPVLSRGASVDDACMFGSIAQLELSSSNRTSISNRTLSPRTPGLSAPSFDRSEFSGSSHALGSVTEIVGESLSLQPSREGIGADEEEDSVESFEEELQRGDGKAKVVVNEMKQMFGSLLRLPKEKVATKRADGCLA